MAAHAGSFDFILDTVAASHDLDAYVTLLKRDGTLPSSAHPKNIPARRSSTSSRTARLPDR
jgi:D-arabinose 1-dehydrogenase-like Zn-dependent alcohol dehydrogenase